MGELKQELSMPEPLYTWSQVEKDTGTELIIDSSLSIFIPKETIAILPHFDTKYDSQSQRHNQPIEQIGLYFSLYRESGIPPRDIPNSLRGSEKPTPLLNPDFLSKSLIPPREYRAGTFTDSTKSLIEHRTKEIISNKQKLQIHIGPLEQVNLAQLSVGMENNQPTYFDVMFFDRIRELTEHTQDYPYGTEITILSNPALSWIFEPYFDAKQITTAQTEFQEKYSGLVKNLLGTKNDKLTITLQSPFQENPVLIRLVQQKRQDLQNLYTELTPLFAIYAKSQGIESGSWKQMQAKQFRNQMSGTDDQYPKRVKEFLAMPEVRQLYKNWSSLELQEFTPRTVREMVWGLEMDLQNTPKNNKLNRVTEYDVNEGTMECVMRSLAYELAMNEIYQHGDESVYLSTEAPATVRYLAGETKLYPRSAYHRFGVSLAPLIEPEKKVTLGIAKNMYGISPSFGNPQINIQTGYEKTAEIHKRNPREIIRGKDDPYIEVNLKGLPPYELPLILPTYN